MGVYLESHIDRTVTGKILDLFKVQSVFHPPGDTGMSQLMRMTVKIQNAGTVRVLVVGCRAVDLPMNHDVPETPPGALCVMASIQFARDALRGGSTMFLGEDLQQPLRDWDIPDQTCGRG